MKSYDSVTPRRRSVVLATVLAIALVSLTGMSLSSAQEAEAEADDVHDLEGEVDEVPAQDAALSDEVAELVLQIEQRDAQIGVLKEQLAVLQQSALSTAQQVEDHRTILLEEQEDLRSSEPFQDEAMAEWRIGYMLGGGQNLRSFESIILPCESGGELDPDAAVGPTDDWGRAQINRPTWSARFTELTGAPFEQHIGTPILNGFMAAHVEGEQGLTAWTCWRKR